MKNEKTKKTTKSKKLMRKMNKSLKKIGYRKNFEKYQIEASNRLLNSTEREIQVI